MSLRQRRKTLARLWFVLAGSAAILMSVSGIAEATYGPPPPPVPVPGGYLSVVTSQTIGTTGGHIGPVSAGNLSVSLSVPSGAKQALQYTITQPDVGAISGIGFCPRCGFRPEAGVGLIIQLAKNGKIFRGNYRHMPVLTISSPLLRRRWLVLEWNGSEFVRVPGVKIRHHVAMIPITGGGYHFFAIVSRHRLRRCPHVHHHHPAAAQGISARTVSALAAMPFGSMTTGLAVMASDLAPASSPQVTLAACFRRMH